MKRVNDPACPECGGGELSRRKFLAAAAVAGAGAGMLGAAPMRLFGAETAKPAATANCETLVVQLYKSLNEEQRKAICFPFDHPLREKVDANWHIVKPSIAKFLTADQQDLVKQIFKGLHSEQYVGKVMEQVEHDNAEDGGFGGCAVALFGEPGANAVPTGAQGIAPPTKFEFVFTGRHVTRRCDGDSVTGAAFGGPIFYGHAAEGFNEKADHPGNAYWFQATRANEVFKSLGGKHREAALRDDPRKEKGTATVKLSAKPELSGVACADLSADQKDLVRKTLGDLLAPFRAADVAESMKLIDAAGGVDSLHMAFYKNMDIGGDGVWDVWQLESPNMVWYFRGSPHVHTWVNIRGAV